MKHISILLIGLLAFSNLSVAQNCSFDQIHEKLMNTDTEYADRHRASEERIYHGVWGGSERSTAVRVIPVVVHVVHRVGIPIGTEENLSDADILTEINQLNARYRHDSQLTFLNPASGVDLEIQICLASQDPDGNSTNGIIRHADDINSANNMDDRNTQLVYNWPTTDYMNLYVVQTICDDDSPCPTSNGVAGYAYFPSSHGQPYDGGVFRASSFWDGLLAHEMGHYFGLYHVFQGSGSCVNNDCTTDGDRICDTPPKMNCCTGPGGCSNTDNTCNTDEDDASANNPFRAVSLGGLGDQPESMENYMDFTASCWEAYTQGQKERMLTAVDVERTSLLSSSGCGPNGINENSLSRDFGFSVSPNPSSDVVAINFNSDQGEKTSYFIYDMYGQLVKQGFFNSISGKNEFALNLSELNDANYLITLQRNNQYGAKRITKISVQ